MIKFRLVCKDCETIFDSWFSSSKEYERLKKKNFLNCHNCNSLNIKKTLMSPNIITPRIYSRMDEKNKEYRKTKKIKLKYQEFIKKNFKYVGENFAYEARSVHYKNKKASRGIYGTATKEDIKELKEEGIETELLPWIKDNTN
tara:strand:+ start:267 stop:695 length:429 start_codon:yes stop_codon:yes gene_type:complete